MSDLSDAALVRRILAGDGEAFALLVRRYRARFAGYALHMLGNREDAEEALQDALVRAWRGLGRCRDPERFDAWFFRILSNRCRTRGAKRRRYEATFVEATEATIRTAQSGVEEDRSWNEAMDRVLAQLTADQREAFLLKYVDDLSYEEMAELTGAGISALKMRVKRAGDRLRELLGEGTHVER